MSRIVARDLTEPSPLALEVLSARPYAYLDDAPLEERRTQAVMARRWIAPEDAAELGRLDPDAIARVREEAWPAAANRDELHDGLAWLGFLTEAEAAAGDGWREWLDELARERRATLLQTTRGPARTLPSPASGRGLERGLWVAAERLPQFLALWPDAQLDPPIAAPAPHAARYWSADEALVEILRSRLEGLGPITEPELAAPLGLAPGEITAALASLQAEGFALRGRFTPGGDTDEWCERRLLARIHRYTLKRLRAEIEPVAARDFLRFLFAWQRVTDDTRMEGPDALAAVLGQLEGFEAPAGAWETEILPARVAGYDPAWLDDQCLAGRIAWARLRPRGNAGERGAAGVAAGPVRTTPITLLARRHAPLWAALSPMRRSGPGKRPGAGRRRFHPRQRRLVLRRAGRRHEAVAPADRGGAGRTRGAGPGQLGQLRRIARVADAGRQAPLKAAARRALFGMEDAGRWALARRARPAAASLDPGRPTRPSSTSRAHCCAATASCSGGFSNARPRGCRHGATCCGCIAGSKRAAKSAADVLSPGFPASSSRCRRRSECCARSAANRARANSSRCPAPTR